MQSTWTDLSGKGVLAMVPAMVVMPDGPLFFRGAMRGGLANVLAKIAGFVCELAHDYYEDADKPIASDLADAAKIKSMKAPDGTYVFPRAEDVGRDFALELLSMDSVRFA